MPKMTLSFLGKIEKKRFVSVMKNIEKGKLNKGNTDSAHLSHHIIQAYSSPFMDFDFGRKNIDFDKAEETHNNRVILRKFFDKRLKKNLNGSD